MFVCLIKQMHVKNNKFLQKWNCQRFLQPQRELKKKKFFFLIKSFKTIFSPFIFFSQGLLECSFEQDDKKNTHTHL